jgi:hypothetical protein
LGVPSVCTDHGEDSIAGAEIIYLEPYGLNDARDFAPHRERKFVLPDLGILALSDFEIDRINADRKVSDEHFLGGGAGDVYVFHLHDLGAAKGIDSYGFHG